MNYKILFSVIFLSIFPLKTMAVGISDTTNGVYLVVAGVRNVDVVTNEPIRFDDRLLWMTFCDKGETELSMCDFRYSVKIKLTDTNGVELAKTTKGDIFGTRFGQAHQITDAKIMPIPTGGSFKDNPELGGAHFLPKPCELFQIEKPGVYTLEIQMQMFYFNPHSTNAWQRDLFEFSPIKIKVEKPPEAKANSPSNIQTNS